MSNIGVYHGGAATKNKFSLNGSGGDSKKNNIYVPRARSQGVIVQPVSSNDLIEPTSTIQIWDTEYINTFGSGKAYYYKVQMMKSGFCKNMQTFVQDSNAVGGELRMGVYFDSKGYTPYRRIASTVLNTSFVIDEHKWVSNPLVSDFDPTDMYLVQGDIYWIGIYAKDLTFTFYSNAGSLAGNKDKKSALGVVPASDLALDLLAINSSTSTITPLAIF